MEILLNLIDERKWWAWLQWGEGYECWEDPAEPERAQLPTPTPQLHIPLCLVGSVKSSQVQWKPQKMSSLHSHLTELAVLSIPSWSLTNPLAPLLLLLPLSNNSVASSHYHCCLYHLYYCTGGGRKGAWPLVHVRLCSNISETRRAQWTMYREQVSTF